MTLRLAHTRAELAGLTPRGAGRHVGLVATMGALHGGHASLMRAGRDRVGDGPVVVSVFVNPLQFGPTEDLARYPRTPDADLAVCEREGVDVVFAPSVEEVYPAGVSGAAVTVDPGPLGSVLEGEVRPGHFVGVLTVVAKLFGLVRPDVAVFGQKDYQQLALIRRMADDLFLGVEVLGAPTQRDSDGLALSSRNRYLSAADRVDALSLSRALSAARDQAAYGEEKALTAAHAELSPAVDLDYLVVRSADLAGPAVPGQEGRILVAARVGTTRLIDNQPITF